MHCSCILPVRGWLCQGFLQATRSLLQEDLSSRHRRLPECEQRWEWGVPGNHLGGCQPAQRMESLVEVSVVLSLQSRSSMQHGDMDGARRLGRLARLLSVSFIILGIVIIIVAINVLGEHSCTEERAALGQGQRARVPASSFPPGKWPSSAAGTA